VLAFDARTGKERWKYETTPIECTDTPPAILDVDGDGKLEVVYGTFKGRLHVIDAETGDGERVYDVVPHFVQTGPTVLDLNGDGVKDYVCATFKGDNSVHAVDGKSGERLWRFKVPGKHMGMYHGCSVGDVTGDGRMELVIAAYDGKVYCLRGRDGEKIWVADPGERYIMSPTVLADVDRDGRLEVLVASQRVTMIEDSGKIRWQRSLGRTPGDSSTRGVSVADLDGDGYLDVATLSGSGLFRVERGKDGRVLYEFDAATLTEESLRSSSHGVTIADLTGDGKLDVFFVVGGTRPRRHGLAVCLTGFPGRGRGWYAFRHDAANTGNTQTPLDPKLLLHIEGIR
jgi:outer membrane protein assembly factor BamB